MADAPRVAPKAKSIGIRSKLQMALTVGVWIAGLFVGAGRADWTRGWISVGIYLTGMAAIGLVLKRANPELMAERAQWHRKDTKGFDKVFLAALMPLTMFQPVIAGMDAARYGWTSLESAWVYPGAIVYGLGAAMAAWPMVVNRHAETTVRIQTDRGHSVVTWGPYRFVRHPMYVGAILMFVAFPLLWGSLAAMGISGAIVALFVWRTYMEDRTLERELPGYAEYASRTRFRLVPGLW